MRRVRATVFVAVAILAIPGAAVASTPRDLGEPAEVSSDWTIPWDISWSPDGAFALVTERDDFGVWRIAKDGSGKSQVGEVPESQTTDGEGGLMGVAFSPTWDGQQDKDVFFMHTSDDGNRIAKMAFDGESLSSYEPIMTGIAKNKYHNGGRIAFGPDGYLYAATGDAKDGDLAQDKESLNGKILRVAKDGAPAPDNPFGNEVYSYGHRNPQGLAWDADGRLWSSELGESTYDELNLIEPGQNYGWPICEGDCDDDGMTNPKHTWRTPDASPSGIAYAGGALYMASLRGERMWEIRLDGADVGDVTAHWEGDLGRLRAVAAVPGENAIWVGTTNADNNGGQPDGSDAIYRAEVS